MNVTRKEQDLRVLQELSVEVSMADLQELASVLTGCFGQIIRKEELATILERETGTNPYKMPVAIRLIISLGDGEFRVEEIAQSPGDDELWSSGLLLDILSCRDYSDYFPERIGRWFSGSHFFGADHFRPSPADFRREGFTRTRQPVAVDISGKKKDLVCEWSLMVPFVLAGDGYVPGMAMAKGTVLSFEPGVNAVGVNAHILP